MRQGDAAVEISCSFRSNVFFFFLKRLPLQNIHRWMDARTGPDGRPRESSVGWRWALPESRLSRGQCHKSPDICPAALRPTGKAGKDGTIIYL